MPSLIEKYAQQVIDSGFKGNLMDSVHDILKAFALEIVQASLPEERKIEHEADDAQYGRGFGWNAACSAVLENAQKLINE